MRIIERRDGGAFGRFARFVVVGVACTATNLAIFAILTGVLGIHYVVTTVVAFFAGNYVGFVLNRRYTFRAVDQDAAIQALRYYGVMLASLLANVVAMTALVGYLGVHYLAASLTVTVLFVLLNFAMHAQITFPRNASNDTR